MGSIILNHLTHRPSPQGGEIKNFDPTEYLSSREVGEAMRAIQYRDADIMIAEGTEDAITPLDLASFTKIKACLHERTLHKKPAALSIGLASAL